MPESDKDSFTIKIPEESQKSKDPEKPTPSISIPKKLIKPHRLIKRARKNIDKKSLNQYNRIRGGAPLDLSVGPGNVERSLRILDTLFKEIEHKGYGLRTYRENNSYWMVIKAGKDEVYFQLREKGNRTDVSKGERWPEYEYTPTGELQLAMFRETYDRSGKLLSDTKSQKVEDRLDEFFIKLELFIEVIRKNRLELEERHLQRKRKKEIKEAAEKQYEKEEYRQSNLEKRASTFTKSQYIYDFISEIKKQQSQLDLSEEEVLKFSAWIIWARNHADRLNPVKQMMNEILDH